VKVRWTISARGDLRTIKAHIARDSVLYARRTIERITSAVAQLRTFPERGSKVEKWDRDDIREILVGNYRVIYQIAEKTVYIVTIIHSARQLPGQPG